MNNNIYKEFDIYFLCSIIDMKLYIFFWKIKNIGFADEVY